VSNTDTTPLHLEIAAGEGLYLTQAAKRFPPYRRGRPVTLGCVLRWILQGVRLPDGSRVRLEGARLAGRWLTTAGAIARFLAVQSPQLEDAERPALPRTPGKRRRAIERAGRELDKVGI
jgi:hypothetical protein